MMLGYSLVPTRQVLPPQRALVENRFNRFGTRRPPPAAPPPPRYPFAPPAAPPPSRYLFAPPAAPPPPSYSPHRGGPFATTATWQADVARRRALIQQMEFARLLRENARLSREQAALMAQQTAAQQVPAVPPAAPPTQVSSDPAAPGADLTPTQDAHDAGGESDASAEAPPHTHNKHLLLFAGIVVAAGVGGYVLLKKKKAKP